MANLQDLHAALVNADRAGDIEAATALAQAISQMQKPTYKPINPVDEMSGPQRFMAGMGKGFVDLGRGAGQILGMVSKDDVAESRKYDKPLMDTGAGTLGNIAGNVVATAPALLVPGANTVAGAGLVGALGGALQPTVEGESRFQNAALSGVTGAGAQYGIGKAATYMGNRLAAAQAKGVADTAQNAPRDAIIQRGKEAGFVFSPSQVNPTALNRAAEGYAGKISTEQAASAKNQPIVDALIKKDLGIPKDKAVTPELLQGIRKEAGKAYENVKQAGKIVADDEFAATVSKLGGEEYAAVVKDVPELANGAIGTLSKALDKPEFSASTAVSLVKKLRNDASANFKNAMDPEKKALAQAQRDAAEAIEGLIERNLSVRGMEDAMQKFRDARVKIAMTHQAEDALNSSGNFVAKEYGKLFDKGKVLSGGARQVGEMAATFPKSVQEINRAIPGVSPLDYAAVGGISAATGMPGMMAGLLGRPAVRAAILSKPMQGLMAGAPNYGPGLLTQNAPALLAEMERLGMGGLLGPSMYAAQ